jgi:hypothetical protein
MNFYEKLDDIFDNFVKQHPTTCLDDVLNLKSNIIKAYEYDNAHKGDYIAKMLKVKHFRITENGLVLPI